MLVSENVFGVKVLKFAGILTFFVRKVHLCSAYIITYLSAQINKKLLFKDWKYKGFGQPLPVWFEAAYRGDVEEVRRKIAVSDDCKIEIVTAQGINSDQANKSLWEQLIVMSQLFELYDQTWVLLGEKEAAAKNNSYPYYAAAVILIDKKKE